MRLVIPFPEGWAIETGEGGWVKAASAGGVVAVSPVRPLPAVVGGDFFVAEVGAGLPAGADLRIGEPVEHPGARGWPVTLIRGEVRAPSGEVIERRLAAIYRLLDRFATVLTIGDVTDEVILGGDLDWSGPPASLAEILGVSP